MRTDGILNDMAVSNPDLDGAAAPGGRRGNSDSPTPERRRDWRPRLRAPASSRPPAPAAPIVPPQFAPRAVPCVRRSRACSWVMDFAFRLFMDPKRRYPSFWIPSTPRRVPTTVGLTVRRFSHRPDSTWGRLYTLRRLVASARRGRRETSAGGSNADDDSPLVNRQSRVAHPRPARQQPSRGSAWCRAKESRRHYRS